LSKRDAGAVILNLIVEIEEEAEKMCLLMDIIETKCVNTKDK